MTFTRLRRENDGKCGKPAEKKEGLPKKQAGFQQAVENRWEKLDGGGTSRLGDRQMITGHRQMRLNGQFIRGKRIEVQRRDGPAQIVVIGLRRHHDGIVSAQGNGGKDEPDAFFVGQILQSLSQMGVGGDAAGNALYRVTLTAPEPVARGFFTFYFSMGR